jgi:hypothetical protein
MARYLVLIPFARGPRAEERFEPGAVVELDDAEAEHLLASGTVGRVPDEESQMSASTTRRGRRDASS